MDEPAGPVKGNRVPQDGVLRGKKAVTLRLLWVLLLPVLYYLPDAGRFLYSSPEAVYSDLVISHLPNLIFLKEALAGWGTIPLWSPLILSGAPFAANPLSGLWYPPGWLALLLPVPWGFNLLVVAHLVWGGYGLYRLGRGMGLREPAAVLAGVGFAGLPKLAAHYGAGHLSLLYAVPWTPWLFLAWRVGEGRRPGWVAGAVLALIFFADVRWAAYAGFAGVFWLFAHSQLLLGQNPVQGRLGRVRLTLKAWAGPALAGLVPAVLLSAPLALPLLEYTRLTTRAQLGAADVLAFSLPPARLLGLVFPDLAGNPEWMLYPGSFILSLGLLVYVWPVARGEARYWAWLLPVSLLFSLGEHIPGMDRVAALPGFSLLRVPPRALFLSGLALVVLSAFSVDHILAGLNPPQRKRAGLILVALAGFAAALSVSVWAVTGTLPSNFIWGSIAVGAAFIWISAGIHRKVPGQFWIMVVYGFCILDWAVVNRTLLAPRPASQVLSEGADVAAYLADQGGLFRVYSPSYSMPQQTGAAAGLELADGVDPLQLWAYADFMTAATGVPVTGYSVTIPPFARGDPAGDNALFVPDPERLGWLNVRYVLSEFDLDAEGLALQSRIGGTLIYENSSARPRAWVQTGKDSIGDALRPAEVTHISPNQVHLQAAGPGVLVLSEIAYPGWAVRVDGSPAEMLEVAGLLRGVTLPPGPHEIEFSFRPLSVYVGSGIGLLTLVFLGNDLRRRRAWARSDPEMPI